MRKKKDKKSNQNYWNEETFKNHNNWLEIVFRSQTVLRVQACALITCPV